MHPLKTFLITSGSALLLAATASGESVQQLMTEAQTAYLRGDLETAKRNFTMVVRLDPKNRVAANYLGLIKTQEAKQGGSNQQEKQLAALIVPQVQFRDATLGSALEYLKQQASKVSGGKTEVNFVLQLPEDVVKSQTVTLNLTKVPFTEVLRYIGDLAGITFTYEKYAISVKPKAAAAAVATQPAQQ